MHVEGFFDPATSTISYLLFDKGTRTFALIDSVLDYDPKSGRTGTESADRLLAKVEELGGYGPSSECGHVVNIGGSDALVDTEGRRKGRPRGCERKLRSVFND